MQLPLFPLEGGNADEDKGAGFVHHPSVQRTHDQVDRLGAARHYGLNLVTVEWSESPKEQHAISPGGRASQQQHHDPGAERLESMDRAWLHRCMKRSEQEQQSDHAMECQPELMAQATVVGENAQADQHVEP